MAKEDIALRLSLIDGVSRSIADIRKNVNDLGASIVKVNAAAELTGKAFDAIKTAGGFLADQVTGVGNFEQSLAALQAVTGASAEELDRLKNAAIAASQASIFSSTEAADGLAELARAGYSASDAISTLNPVLALAQGQQLSVAESSKFVTTTLTQFGLAATDAARAADVLASVADKSQTDVRQVGDALSYSASIAAQAGLSLEETTAIIGKLADAGFQGSRGGTAFANALTALQDPSSKFAKALDSAGIKTRDFTEVMQALADKGDGAGKILLSLDTTARPAILALARQGSSGIKALNAALSDASGSAQRTADIMGGTFNSIVKKFENNIENLRNAVIAPILEPLGDEITRLSERLIAFSQSKEFDVIVENFTKIATAGIKGFGDFVASVDLTDALTRVVDFSTAVAENLATIASAFDIAGRTIGGFGDLVSITFQSLKGVTASVGAAIIEPLAVFDEGAEGLWRSLREQAEESEKSVGKSLDRLSGRFGGTSESADRFKRLLDGVAPSAKSASSEIGRLADALVPKPFAALADAVKKAVDELKELVKVPEPAKISLGNLAEAADIAGLSITQLEQRLKDVRESLEAAPVGSPEFVRLAQDAAKLELEISKAKDKIKEAGDEVKGTGDKANNAAGSLRNFASAAGDAGDAAGSLRSSNSQVSDSFGNIGQAAAAAQADLGNMSKKLIDLAIQMQSQARSGRDVIDVWESINRQYQESEKRVQDRIARLERQNAAMDEEAQIRRRLHAMYGDDTTSIERLVQLELQRTQAVRDRAKMAEREAAAIERQQAAIAGGFGAQQTQQEQAPAATSSRGSAAGGGRSAPQIVINVQGMTTDQARAFVEQSVVPELERINRLSR